MKFFSTILLLFVSSFVIADKWDSPSEMASASPNSKYVVRVVPPELNTGEKSIATLFVFDGVSYTELSRFPLRNEISPVNIVITNQGRVFTFDNWASMGFGEHVVAIYSSSGELKKTYRLEDLYGKEDFEKIKMNRSVSSIHWQCSSSRPWTHYDLVFVRDTIGGSFIFDDDGGFSYKRKDGCYHR